MQIKLFIFSVLLGTAFILSKTLNMNTFCPHLIKNNINILDASTHICFSVYPNMQKMYV